MAFTAAHTVNLLYVLPGHSYLMLVFFAYRVPNPVKLLLSHSIYHFRTPFLQREENEVETNRRVEKKSFGT